MPTILLNGQEFGQGGWARRDPRQVDSGAEARAAAEDRQGAFDVLVVGGGPAGAAAAIAARKGIRTGGVVTERFGGQVLDTLAIENFISVKETETSLAAALEAARQTVRVDIMNLQRAEA